MKNKRFLFVFMSVVLVMMMAACSGGDGKKNVNTPSNNPSKEPNKESVKPSDSGTEIKKLTMGFVPSQDADKIADTVKPLADRLSELLGVEIDARVMVDYVGLVEGMRTQQIDIGFLSAFGFVQAEERADVVGILKSIRNGEDSYRAQFNVRADLEDVNSIEDLLNKKDLRWAYGDSSSTSGFLFPASHLMDMGIEDLDSHFVQTSVGGHDTALIALLNGDADMATTFEDARTRVEGDHPEVMEKVKVIGYTAPIPNDTISLRSGMSDEWIEKIKSAFLSFNDDPDMLVIFDQVYNWSNIAEMDPKDYDVVRSTYDKFREMLSQ